MSWCNTASEMDKIIVRQLQTRSIIGVDSWERVKEQPSIITVIFNVDIASAGSSDDLGLSLSYSDAAKTAVKYVESTSFKSIEALSLSLILLFFEKWQPNSITVQIQKPRALLHAQCAGVEMTRTKEECMEILKRRVKLVEMPNPSRDVPVQAGNDSIFIRDFMIDAIVGVNPWEREEKQKVIINITAHLNFSIDHLLADRLPRRHDLREIARVVRKFVENSNFLTIEAFVSNMAQLCIERLELPRVTVSIAKPSALMFAKEACVEIVRLRPDTDFQIAPAQFKCDTDLPHIVYVSFGSNLGDRMKNINLAIEALEADNFIRIVDTSFLYETTPMYLTEQPLFLNGALKLRTKYSAFELLRVFKDVEAQLGRDFNTVRNGPRPIDLDILFFDDSEILKSELTVPHPRIQEREFVLRPLCDIAAQFEHPSLYRSISQLLAFLKQKPSSDRIYRVLPLRGRALPIDGQKTYLMGILNVTPDSFSDGGLYDNIENAVDRACEMIKDGADIIDIGGQSTRPGADEMPEEEELRRVTPVIRAMRVCGEKASEGDEQKELLRIPISIDTYRPNVARAAIEAGADMVNDVTGGDYGGEEMIEIWRKNKIPICVMHMRGNPKTMMDLNKYDDVVLDIRDTLGNKSSSLISKGLHRWNLILDPGIGFAKDSEQNFAIIRRLKELNATGTFCARMPLLIGASRKGFIGQVTGSKDPRSEGRVWGTAGAITAAVAGGAHILRVHDVREMRHVTSVADKCFK